MTECGSITVKVRQVDTIKEFKVSPSTTAKAISNMATGLQGFSLPDDQKVSHDLTIADEVLELAEIIGSFSDEECTVTLYLTPQDRFRG